MDHSIRLREKYRAMRDEGRWPCPQPESEPRGTFEHFTSDEERQRHQRQVQEAQANGAPF